MLSIFYVIISLLILYLLYFIISLYSVYVSFNLRLCRFILSLYSVFISFDLYLYLISSLLQCVGQMARSLVDILSPMRSRLSCPYYTLFWGVLQHQFQNVKIFSYFCRKIVDYPKRKCYYQCVECEINFIFAHKMKTRRVLCRL